MTCLLILDGREFNVNSRRAQYREVDGSFSYATSYAPLQSDITTAVSLAATVTRLVGGLWMTGYIWRCIFVAMERGGISAKGVSRAISSWPPAPHHFNRKSSMVIIYIALFATLAIEFFSAFLTGSIVWEAAGTRVPGKIPLSGITDGLGAYSNTKINHSDFSYSWPEIMSMGSASASMAWGTPLSDSILNITEPSTTFRRAINGAQYISNNSTLAKVTMPYFALNAFEWVPDPHQVLTDNQSSLLVQNADWSNPFMIRENGTGGLLPNKGWGTGPPTLVLTNDTSHPLPISETRLFTFRIWIPWSSPKNTTAPPCPQNYTIDPGLEINFISGSDYPDGRDCFAIANVSYKAGVMNSQNCKIISPNVVEAQGVPSSIIGNIYTGNALGLAPILAANFFLSGYAIPLNYGTRRNFAIELTSRAYQAAWAAMADLYTTNTNATAVQIALPTLSATIIRWRVCVWAALHLWVLVLGLLFTYIQSRCDHPWVENPTMTIFWLDTRALLAKSDGQLFWDPWQPGTEIPSHEDGMLVLEQNEAGQRSVQVKRSSGSGKRSVQVERSTGLRQRRYSDSIPLRRRMPPSSSTILGDQGRESVEALIVPNTSLLDSTTTPENSAE